MTKFSEGIIGKIKCDHIAPVPRWHFLLKGYVFWCLLAVSLLLGSLSFSVIVHLISVGDVDIFKYLQGNIITSTVMLLPYFWFLSLVIFALVAFYNWKHTRLGYKFKRRWIFMTSIALSIFLGSVLYVFGMGNKVDQIMARVMPLYGQSKNTARNELWLQPENGLLVGKVVNINNADKSIIIKDEQGRDWSIDEKAVDTKTEPTIKKGKILKIIGKKNGENNFIAKEIRRCGDCQDVEEADISTNKNVDISGNDLNRNMEVNNVEKK